MFKTPQPPVAERNGAARPLGERIIVIGSSCSGKSTLARQLAEMLGLEFVELDALYWKPGWQSSDNGEFAASIATATAGGRWVVAGNYTGHTVESLWPRAEAIIWLDFPLALLIYRIVRRSWSRSRKKELLWGTNHEKFWPQLKLWDKEDSLIAYTVSTAGRRRAQFTAATGDERLAHVRFLRLKRPSQVAELLRATKEAAGAKASRLG